MRATNKLFALPRVIALAGGLLVTSPAFASLTDLDVSNVDLQPNRTEVTLTVTPTCETTTNYATVTVSIHQNQGRHNIIGTYTTTPFLCTAGAQNISVTLPQGNLKFQPGPATLYVSGDETDQQGAPVLNNTTFQLGEKINLH
jgi:hypothetical protein